MRRELTELVPRKSGATIVQGDSPKKWLFVIKSIAGGLVQGTFPQFWWKQGIAESDLQVSQELHWFQFQPQRSHHDSLSGDVLLHRPSQVFLRPFKCRHPLQPSPLGIKLGGEPVQLWWIGGGNLGPLDNSSLRLILSASRINRFLHPSLSFVSYKYVPKCVSWSLPFDT